MTEFRALALTTWSFFKKNSQLTIGKEQEKQKSDFFWETFDFRLKEKCS